MATTPSLTGFWPLMNVGSTSTQTIRRRTASGNGTAIFWGDCAKYTAAGVAGLATAGGGLNFVCQGASYWDATINGRRENPYLPVSTSYSASVFDDYGNTDESFLYLTADPVNTRFQCQYSGSTVALTDITKNANFSVGSGGSTTTGISSHVLNQATLATTAALDFNIDDIKHNVLADPTQTALGKVIVRINLGLVPPFQPSGTAGV